MFFNKIILLFIVTLTLVITTMAQNKNDYAATWKKVAAFEKKGLTKSALEQVIIIYNSSLKDNNDVQQIKAAMYQIEYRNMVEQDSHENNIFFLDTLILKAKAPAKNILQNIQAEMFWEYLKDNRYKLYDHTMLAIEDSKDITTWSLDKLNNTISTLYQASLENEQLLKATKLNGFDSIIIKGVNTLKLRPTLFDFLAFRSLSYFMNDENNLTKPAYQFTINNAKAFAPASEFITASFTTKDTASLQHKAILLLQQILQFHLKDNNPNALLDADLIRLNFVNEHAVNENKIELYKAALKNMETLYSNNPAIAQAMYLRAQVYNTRGEDFDPLTKGANQYEIKRAKELCETAISKFPKSEGGINAQNLLNEILQPTLSLKTEKVNIPGQPFRTLVNYKNVKTVYFRIIKTSKDELNKMDRKNVDKLWAEIVALKSIKNWSVALPDPQDFQGHSTEIKVAGLPAGIYLILSSIDENFSLQKNIIAKQLTYISTISYIHKDNNEYYVLNRDNGQPLNNALVTVWYAKYNYTSGQNEDVKAANYSTDKNGFFKITPSKEYRNIKFQINAGSEELFLEDNNYSYNYNSFEKPVPSKPITFLFTDRSIYRPGQTIYFKGIVLQQGNKASETHLLPAFNTTIQLKDANNQKVTELQMATNEFGSYHGSFKLPEGMLNGQFSLYDSSTKTAKYFNVEEYKRPKFLVAIQKPTGTYRLLDSVEVTGTAKGYAGNNIDGAKVVYRVVRKVRYPIWWSGGYASLTRKFMPHEPSSDEMEITNGEATTDANGKFKITFKALPDASINKKDQPTFDYEVSADITDINGETRSGSTSVSVAYQALQLEILTPGKISVDSLKNLTIKSTNLNYIEEKTIATVTIEALKIPNKIFRERFWNQPDQFVMSRDEYYTNFPYDVYKNENEVKNYEVAEKVFEKIDSTNEAVKISGNPLKAGWYKIVATTKDKYGEAVRAERFIQLFDTKNFNPSNEAIEVRTENDNTEPRQKINYNIVTGFNNIWLIQSLTKINEIPVTTYQTITQNKPYKNEISVNETDRGGMAISYAFVQHNRFYEGNENFDIPWSNKELKIEYATFRDKILPGSEEKWKVKISGSKGEKVAAEMLVSMYDASLDQFKPHSWNRLNIWPNLNNSVNWVANGFATINSEEYNKYDYKYLTAPQKTYDELLFDSNDMLYENVRLGFGNPRKRSMVRGIIAFNMKTGSPGSRPTPPEINQVKFTPPKIVADGEIKADMAMEADSASVAPNNINSQNPSTQIRKNFNETAFFFPDLQTDADGNVTFAFTIPEALTQWKLMTFVHTKNLASGYSEKTTITQKPLMVQPNAPRFLREGDGMEFSAKIVNLSDKEITGTTQLELLDAATNKPVDGWFKNVFPTQYFTVAAGQSAAVKFPIEIPFNFNSAMTYRITTKSNNDSASVNGGFSDGEEMSIPILTNRMLVTESMPINLHNEITKTFKFDKLLNSGNSQTLVNHALTVEYTSNPIWYAVQALPYLMQYPYECAEQTFSKYYANTLASSICNSMPKIKAVFDKWATGGNSAALLSNLQKNEELKSAMLQETPWVLDAQNEREQKKNIALLFDMVKMSSETDKAIAKLKEMQSSNGGFVWFKGGTDDRYITQYIITGIGHLKNLNALSGNSSSQSKDIMTIVNKALPYLDKKIKEEYDNLIKYKAILKNDNLSNTAIQYLYMRSFFTETPISASTQIAYNYYREQSKKYWLNNSKYMQAMIALALNRSQDVVTPKAIINSLKENSINNEELGMYWKEFTNSGYYWYQAPIESQALMIEAFTEIYKNTATIDNLKTWLLKQKQTQNWKTTKATAEACYALLLNGSNLLSTEKEVTINLGNAIVKSTDDKTEAGTGYFKKTFDAAQVIPAMGNITVTTKNTTTTNPSTNNGTSWGSVYWQYFEDLDKITFAATPLQLTKKLFIEKNTDKGPELIAIPDGGGLKVGDKVKVRITLKVDRDMEYVHMKDMRAACMEPTNVLSEYKYQGGLGYYETTKDASTNFFFGNLTRGNYVFEYELFVTTAGNFSNGITSIQCMYAPEFTSHSEGIRLVVE